MRLWHKDFIDVLPREQLVAQWRECSAIAGSIIKNGTPNHLLVNYVVDNIKGFIVYSSLIRKEMFRRKYKTMDRVMDKINSLSSSSIDFNVPKEEVLKDEHEFKYLTFCYFNLYEKYYRGGISEEDFKKINEVYKKQYKVNPHFWED